MASELLKGLQVQRTKIIEQLQTLKNQQRDVSREVSFKEQQLRDIDGKIKQLQVKDITVSEHAMLRYIERVMGIDLNEVRRNILTEQLKTQINTLGNGVYPVSGPESAKARVRDNVVVTIIVDEEEKPKAS